MSESFAESPLNGFLKSEYISEEEKRSIAFQVLVAVREAIGFGYKAAQPPTYNETMKFLCRLDPSLSENLNNLLNPVSESEDLKYFKDTAKLLSKKEKTEIRPEILIKAEIERNTQLKQDAFSVSNEAKSIDRRIRHLKSLLEELLPAPVTENAVLRKDFTNERKNLFAEKLLEEYNYADFALPNDRFLRIRILHPDVAEHTTGADLVYEQVDLVTQKVRFVFLQYKMWDNNDKVLYFKGNTFEQLIKLNEMLCCGNFCSSRRSTDSDKEFRFPYCTGFLRPTNRLQKANSKLISSGLYLPVCKAIQMAHDEGKIDKKEVQEYCLNHKVFEELFNLNLLGSRWFDFDEAEQFYEEKKIIKPNGFIRLYSREFINSKSRFEFDDGDLF